MPGSVKVGGAWKTVSAASVKVGGAWKTVSAGYTKIGGAWKQWYSSAAPASFEHISTVLASGLPSQIDFDVTGLGSTYKHLQLRATLRRTVGGAEGYLRFNDNVSTNTYYDHALTANGSSVSYSASTGNDYISTGLMGGTNAVLSSVVIDILDFASSTKNKTVKIFNGVYDTGSSGIRIQLRSGLFKSTSPITKVTIANGQFPNGVELRLYGIKG